MPVEKSGAVGEMSTSFCLAENLNPMQPGADGSMYSVGGGPNGSARGLGKKKSMASKVSRTMDGGGFSMAMMATGRYGSMTAIDDSEGAALTIFQAFMVVFCCAFGAVIALVGWYPKLVGVWGFTLCIVGIALTGAVATNALHVVCIKRGVSSFAELTMDKPWIVQKITTICPIPWGFTVGALYCQFIYNFINVQILTPAGAGLPIDGGVDSLVLYIPIGVAVFLVILPPKFAGRLIEVISWVNLVTTWVVIITAVAKGIVTMTSHPQRPAEYLDFDSSNLMRVTILLSGAMLQCMPVPRIQFELKPELKVKASWQIPIMLASVQIFVFLLVGYMGYFALGACILPSGDVFGSYSIVANDFMVTILQGGIALLMFLSMPLMAVSPKSEMWSLVGRMDEEGNPVELEDAGLLPNIILSFLMAAYGILLPITLGRANVTIMFSIMAGTFANWLNLFLPASIVIFDSILPDRKADKPILLNVIKVCIILGLAFAVLGGSVAQVVNIICCQERVPDVIDETTCWGPQESGK